MKEKHHFKNRPCILVKKDGFILHGITKEINDAGIFFETTDKTSFLSWSNIRELIPEGD